MRLSDNNAEMNINEDLISRVEDAARRGAEAGAMGTREQSISSTGLIVCVIILIFGVSLYLGVSVNKRWEGLLQEAKDEFSAGMAKDDHDLIVDDPVLPGYTAADFAEAIIGDSMQLKKLEVYKQDIVDAVTITTTGLANIKLFEKAQVITYHGSAVYTVDLGDLTRSDVALDDDEKTVTLYIPHCTRETINIPEDQMEFGDVSRGFLAFGEIKLTPEQNALVQSTVREKFESKLDEAGAMEQADRFAKMSVWEIYQSVVSGVSPEYTLLVEFK